MVRTDTELERTFDTLVKQLAPELTEPLKNFPFDMPDSRMEIDRYWERYRVGVELNGGTFAREKQAHNSGVGLDRDYRKLAAAHRHNIKLFFFSTKMLTDNPAWCIEQLKIAMIVAERAQTQTIFERLADNPRMQEL